MWPFDRKAKAAARRAEWLVDVKRHVDDEVAKLAPRLAKHLMSERLLGKEAEEARWKAQAATGGAEKGGWLTVAEDCLKRLNGLKERRPSVSELHRLVGLRPSQTMPIFMLEGVEYSINARALKVASDQLDAKAEDAP